ncbi:MAG: hypothetical protein GF401_08675 [Chitinivibrionales bacterium]|nr:hypothetical protein [Chitinivibrionales bacterium]
MHLKKIIHSITIISMLLISLISLPLSAENSGISLGLNVMLGGRYDDLRMCVGSPEGVKGGPIADIMLITRYHLNDRAVVGFKLPVMRPILFGVAFDMLQFEPEFIFEYSIPVNDDMDLVVGPGLGASFHYGPDYETPKDAENPEEFFAAGPFVSALFGLNFQSETGKTRMIGIRPFYTPLFTGDRGTGTVVGAALEGHFGLYRW